jgi:glycerol-3-phosphate O-acyltransferase/dihydroxyacetone phosphate acyltransferase
MPARPDAYRRFKRVEATWRVLLGVWAPKRWEYSLAALEQYTRTPVPPPNPWLERPATPRLESRDASPAPEMPPTKVNMTASAAGAKNATAIASAPLAPAEPHPKRARRPRSGRVMRHVLRARAEAAHALAAFFEALERAPAAQRVRASAHLARAHGGDAPDGDGSGGVLALEDGPAGWRRAREVVAFLKARGAKTAGMGRAEGVREWAMVGSDGEVSGVEMWDSEAEASPKSRALPL